MPIVQSGAINTTALVQPGLWVQIVPPSTLSLNGTPTNGLGLVGTASYGPKNTPVSVGGYTEYVQNFGALQNRQYDAGTYVYIGTTLGASNFTVVRVTDGTDLAATGKFGTTDITFTAKYTGSVGNGIVVAIASGSVASAWNVNVSLPATGQSEQFTNISGSGATFWANLANAINLGQNFYRGPSAIITATAGAGTDTPVAESVTLSGGTDGASGITSANMLGVNTAPYTGMYALQNQGCSVGVLCDLSTSTLWSTIAAFGLAQGILMADAFAPASGVPSASISTNITALQATGAASYALKIFHGDWLYWYDPVNAVYREVSPVAFWAGQRANTSPQNSTLNAQNLGGIVSSQQSGGLNAASVGAYTYNDLALLAAAGIDVIANPSIGGSYWSCQNGNNTGYASNIGTGDEVYTTMTNYLSKTLQSGMGGYVGGSNLISTTLMQNVTATLTNFLANLVQQGLLVKQTDGSAPYAVVCNASNNPQSQTKLGILTANVQVQYGSVVKFFIVNLQGGKTVTVSTAS